MSFARLIVIYLLLGLAVYGFVKRDRILALFAKDPAPEVLVVATRPSMEPATPALTRPPAPPTDAPDAPFDRRKTLEKARQAYWGEDSAAAIAGYEAILAQDPQDIDALGELGNLYYDQGAYDRAAPLFARVADLALEQGDRTLALSMIAILQQIDPASGKALQARFDARQ